MSDLLGWAAIVVFLFACLGSALLFLPAKAPMRVKAVAQPKRKALRRPKDRQKRYYQRKIRTMQAQRQHEQEQWLMLLAVVLYHRYRAEQATVIYN